MSGPTKADRRRVAVAAGGGMPHDEIAVALGLAVPELRALYEYELSVGAHKCRLEVMEALFKQAKAGNVSAAKAYVANQVRMSVAPLPAEIDPTKKDKVEKTGKKEQRNLDAVVAEQGTEWEGLLPKNTH